MDAAARELSGEDIYVIFEFLAASRCELYEWAVLSREEKLFKFLAVSQVLGILHELAIELL